MALLARDPEVRFDLRAQRRLHAVVAGPRARRGDGRDVVSVDAFFVRSRMRRSPRVLPAPAEGEVVAPAVVRTGPHARGVAALGCQARVVLERAEQEGVDLARERLDVE